MIPARSNAAEATDDAVPAVSLIRVVAFATCVNPLAAPLFDHKSKTYVASSIQPGKAACRPNCRSCVNLS